MSSQFEKLKQTLNKPTESSLPFKLCTPLHGVLMGLEWIVADCFYSFGNRPFFAIFVVLFVLHCFFLIVSRRKYRKEHDLPIKASKVILDIIGIGVYILIALFIMEFFFL